MLEVFVKPITNQRCKGRDVSDVQIIEVNNQGLCLGVRCEKFISGDVCMLESDLSTYSFLD